MRSWLSIAILCAVCSGLSGVADAQSEDVPLGDVARSYRKAQAPPEKKVIDNDNLSQVMDQGETKKWMASQKPAQSKAAVQLINFQSPNITCALSFSGGGADALANAPRPERLPDEEVGKIEGPASLIGDTLEISVLNGTAWDVREITVGITIVRKQLPSSAGFLIAPAKLDPIAPENADHKQQDTTLVYHILGTASPYSSAVFREVLDRPLSPNEEWHWAILQAKGLPPAHAALLENTAGNSSEQAQPASSGSTLQSAPSSVQPGIGELHKKDELPKK
jgi:hypothetical protein